MKKFLLSLFVVALLMVGFVYYDLFVSPAQLVSEQLINDQSMGGVDVDDEEVDVQPVFELRGEETLEYLRLLGINIECAVFQKDKNEKVVAEGTYFVNDGDTRGDFLTESPDLSGQIISSVIIDGGTTYVWSEIDGEFYGSKIHQSEQSKSTTSLNEPVAFDQVVTYDCQVWENVDRTVFKPPSEILFKDLTEKKEESMEYGTIY